jgi:hypothetical protein
MNNVSQRFIWINVDSHRYMSSIVILKVSKPSVLLTMILQRSHPSKCHYKKFQFRYNKFKKYGMQQFSPSKVNASRWHFVWLKACNNKCHRQSHFSRLAGRLYLQIKYSTGCTKTAKSAKFVRSTHAWIVWGLHANIFRTKSTLL